MHTKKTRNCDICAWFMNQNVINPKKRFACTMCRFCFAFCDKKNKLIRTDQPTQCWIYFVMFYRRLTVWNEIKYTLVKYMWCVILLCKYLFTIVSCITDSWHAITINTQTRINTLHQVIVVWTWLTQLTRL